MQGRLRRLRLWLAGPTYLPKWALIAKYLLFTSMGAVGLFAGSTDALAQVTPTGYPAAWSGCMACIALVALSGVVVRGWRGAERVGALLLAAFLLVNVVAAFLTGRPFYGVQVLLVTCLPAGRGAHLTRLWWGDFRERLRRQRRR